MPSIFNHNNNACWGIRRTTYNIFNEPIAFDVSVNKTELSTASVNQTVNKIDNCHGSSNGYYGYHVIPTNTEPTDYAMDTSNDVNLATVTPDQPEHDIQRQSQNDEHWRRKRSHPRDQEDSFKRVRKEGPIAEDKTPVVAQDASESSLSNYNETCEEDRHVIRMFNYSKEEELELLENYLKQTHGCDFYNLTKSEDF